MTAFRYVLNQPEDELWHNIIVIVLGKFPHFWVGFENTELEKRLSQIQVDNTVSYFPKASYHSLKMSKGSEFSAICTFYRNEIIDRMYVVLFTAPLIHSVTLF